MNSGAFVVRYLELARRVVLRGGNDDDDGLVVLATRIAYRDWPLASELLDVLARKQRGVGAVCVCEGDTGTMMMRAFNATTATEMIRVARQRGGGGHDTSAGFSLKTEQWHALPSPPPQ